MGSARGKGQELKNKKGGFSG